MSITRTSVKRPLTIIMVFVIVLLFGIIGYLKMPSNIMPDIDIPVVMVQTTWQGAGPEDIDKEVSEPIEKALSSVQGVKTTTSQSGEGYSMVVAQFEYGTKVDDLLNDIRSKVDTVQSSLPDDVNRPTIQKFDMNSEAISFIIVEGEGNSDDIMQYAEDIVEPKLESVDGVNAADIQGGDKTQINVVADQAVLRNYGISLDAIKGILASSNKTTPYGSITQGEDSLVLRGVDKIESLEDVRLIQIPTNEGETVNLGTICSVNYGSKEKESIQRYNGKPALRMDIKKQQDGNIVQVMNKVNKTVDQLNKENEQFKLTVAYDESSYIRASIKDVMLNIVLSSVIAFGIILLFLKSLRASLVISVAIPTSIIGSIALLYFTGETLNMVTLSSLVIAVGIVVDDAIVVIDNIFKHRRSDNMLDVEEISVKGTQTVSNAIMASTLTKIAIFLPIMFTEGFTKIMFGALAKTLIFALTLSLIVAMTIVPSIYAKLSGGKNAAKMREKPTPLFDKISAFYERFISWSLKRKTIVVLTSFGLFIGSIVLGFSGLIGMDFMSMGDQGMVQISMKLPDGLDLKPSEYYVSMAEEKIMNTPELDRMLTEVDKSSGSIYMMLTPRTERDRSASEIEKEVAEKLKVIPDCEITVGSSGMGGSSGGSVSISIKGPDLDVLEVLSNQAEEKLKAIPNFRNVQTTLSDSKEEVQFKIDKRKAALYGVNTVGIGSTLRTAITGTDATTVTIDGYSMDINLKLKEDSINSIEDVGKITVTSAGGKEVPLSAFADIQIAKGVKSISRTDGDYSIAVSGIADGMDTNKANNLAMQAIKQLDFPKDYGLDVGGDAEQMNEAMSGLVSAMLISIVLVYMVMVAQFESFSRPFIIMFSIPFAFIGVVLALVVSRISLNVIGMLGAILLIGMVVNNGIVLIDYIEQLRKSDIGGSLEQIVAKGSSTRLRPVLMTALTSIIGMLPSAFAFGEGGEMMQPLSVVVIGGLSVSTLVTLVLIPTIYIIFDNIETSVKKKLRKIFNKDSDDEPKNDKKMKFNFKNILKSGKEKIKSR